MLNSTQQEQIIALYKSGKSINNIAKKLQISWDTVKRTLVKKNIELIPSLNQYGKKQTFNNLFSAVDNYETAYWLGFLYADGSIRGGTRNEICLELKEEDYETIKQFHKFCNNNNTIREHIIERDGKSFKSYVSSFSDAQVKANLIKLGCVPKKSLILQCPTEEQVPKEFFNDFLRGYFDGDGYGRFDLINHKYDIVILGTQEFLTGVVKRADLNNVADIKATATKVFKLVIYGKQDVYNFLQMLYDNDHPALMRKKHIFLQAKDSGI